MIPPIHHDFQSSGEQSSVVMKFTQIFLIFPAATVVFFDDFIMKKTASFASEPPAARPEKAPKPGTFGVKAHAVLAVAQEQAAVAGGESYSNLRPERAIEDLWMAKGEIHQENWLCHDS